MSVYVDLTPWVTVAAGGWLIVWADIRGIEREDAAMDAAIDKESRYGLPD